MGAIVRWLVVVAALLYVCGHAHANCPTGVPPPTSYVGSDNKCQYAKIQDAITAVSPTATCAPIIIVTNEHEPAWNEALTIAGRSFTLVGSAGGCGTINNGEDLVAASPTTPQAVISGSGLGAPVIKITGTSKVTVQNLEITGGLMSGNSSEGGGIFFNGNGSLTLSATTIDGNQAAYGGGIDVTPVGGSATLTLQQNTLILSNTAGISGGGIRIEGPTRLFMLADGSTVSFNDAQFDYGGGIEVLGPARADIGSSGAVVVGAVSNNSAPYGGGVAIIGTSAGDGTVRVFSTNATQPVLISENTSTGLGGGFYLLPYNDGDTVASATLCAYNSRMDSNRAPDGAAIYGGSNEFGDIYGSSVLLNPSGDCGPESPASLGSVACATGEPCNEISHNQAIDSGGNASGATIAMNTFDTLAVEKTKLSGNSGKSVIDAEDSYVGYYNYLHGCLIVDNQVSDEVIDSIGGFFGATFAIANCTLANNTIANGYAIFARDSFTLTDTIIDQPGTSALDYQIGTCESGPCVESVSYVMSNDISTLPASSNVIAIDPADPLFVDAAHGNYRLVAYRQNGSLIATRAIDFAPTENGDADNDFTGNAYGQDVPAVPDAYGTRDLGAYEMTPIADRIFGDAFGDKLALVN